MWRTPAMQVFGLNRCLVLEKTLQGSCLCMQLSFSSCVHLLSSCVPFSALIVSQTVCYILEIMTIEDVANKADAWSEAIKKIVKAITAAGVAVAVAVGGLLAWWPFGNEEPSSPPALIKDAGYSAQCSQLYSAIDHTWTENQWSVWENLRRDLEC